MRALVELATLLDTGLNETALTAIMDLLRSGVHPQAVVATVRQLRSMYPTMALPNNNHDPGVSRPQKRQAEP